MKTVIKIFLSFVFVLSATFAKSQKVEINILGEDDNRPIPYAQICTENITNNTKNFNVTNISGKLELLITGKTIISISLSGYQTIIDTISNNISKKEFVLKKNNFEVEEVVVTGQHEPIPKDKSIYQIKLIGKSEIEQKAANNLSDLLSNELNISLSHDPSTGTGMKMQGISGENVKILIDGVPVIGRISGNIDLSQIDLSNVEQVEIVEGPMSVVYGTNALAGVINIITKENKYARFKTGINTYYETVGTYNTNVDLSVKKKRNFMDFNIGRNFFDGFDTDTSTRSVQFKPKEQYNAGFDYAYISKKIDIKYKTDLFKEQLLDRSDLITTPYLIKGFDTWFYTLRINNNISLSQQLSDCSSYKFLAAYSYYNRERLRYQKNMTTLETVLTNGAGDHDTTRFDAIVARGVYSYIPKNNKINIQSGFDFNLEYGTGKRLKNKKETIQDYAAFTDFMWNITPNFTFQPGLRASYNTKYNSPLVPALNLKYNISNFTLRASYSRGFRAPSLKELYLNFYDSNHQIEGNENLQAEYSHNFNLSVNKNFGTVKNKFEITIKTFYNSIENMISLVQVDPNNDLHYTNKNIGHFTSVGGEAKIQYNFLPFIQIDGGYSRMGRTDFYDDKKLIFNNNFNSSLTLSILKNSANISLYYKYIGKYPFYTYYDKLELNYMNAYHNLDLTISKNFFHKNLVVSGGVKNILNNIEIKGTASGTTSSHGDSNGVSSLADWGRTYFINIKINISKY